MKIKLYLMCICLIGFNSFAISSNDGYMIYPYDYSDSMCEFAKFALENSDSYPSKIEKNLSIHASCLFYDGNRSGAIKVWKKAILSGDINSMHAMGVALATDPDDKINRSEGINILKVYGQINEEYEYLFPFYLAINEVSFPDESPVNKRKVAEYLVDAFSKEKLKRGTAYDTSQIVGYLLLVDYFNDELSDSLALLGYSIQQDVTPAISACRIAKILKTNLYRLPKNSDLVTVLVEECGR